MRRGITIVIAHEWVHEGWPAFAIVARICAKQGFSSDHLEYRGHQESWGNILATFEVLP